MEQRKTGQQEKRESQERREGSSGKRREITTGLTSNANQYRVQTNKHVLVKTNAKMHLNMAFLS